MSLPQRAPRRKLRRLGLWAPFAVAFLGVVALCVSWFWMRGKIERRMESVRAAFVTAGGRMDWDRRTITGFPFRLDVMLDNARVREPSGWGLAARNLKAEAFVFSPTHWVVVAPSGAIVLRRRGGPLLVGAKVLRASVSEILKSPPRISIEGLGLAFTPLQGASPFPLLSASELHFHSKSGPDDQGAAYLEIDGAVAQFDGLLGRVANHRRSRLVIDAIYSDAKALSGAGWSAAVRHWGMKGGRLNVRRLDLVAGQAEISERGGGLGVGADGRLTGRLDLVLRQAPRTLSVMGAQGVLPPDAARAAVTVAGAEQQGSLVSLPLSFEAGRTTLGPLAIGPAPRLY